MEITYKTASTPIGEMMLAATEDGVCFISFAETKDQLIKQLKSEYKNEQISPVQKSDKQFDIWIKSILDYLSGNKSKFNIPVDVKGTEFQAKVWKYLQSIPAGSTRSYTEVADSIGKPKAVRAVATACASNNVSILIPCHRVIRQTGELAGYRWGIDRKKVLLEIEKKTSVK